MGRDILLQLVSKTFPNFFTANVYLWSGKADYYKTKWRIQRTDIVAGIYYLINDDGHC